MKRVYTEDGNHSAPFWFVATCAIAALPILLILLPWAFTSTLVREIVSAFRFAWLEVRMEVDVFIKIMRSGR